MRIISLTSLASSSPGSIISVRFPVAVLSCFVGLCRILAAFRLGCGAGDGVDGPEIGAGEVGVVLGARDFDLGG